MIAPDPIRAAQRALGLTDRDALFATLLNVDDEAIHQARSGDPHARDRVIAAASLVLGVEPHELIFDGPDGRASTALLKTLVDPLHASAFQEAALQHLQQDLGAFVRRLRRKAWLRTALGDPSPALPTAVTSLAQPTPPQAEESHGADVLAMRLRVALGLGIAPIVSMVALIRDVLSIDVQVTRGMWGQIDGASYAVGVARGVLVNVSERARPRRIRMTLAHELCHVLFDGDFAGDAQGGMLAFSPGGERSQGVSGRASYPAEAFVRREQRASSFAAYLLAPPEGVRSLLGESHPPQSRATVDTVAEHFGLSRVTALNVIANVYQWSKDERLSLSQCFEDAPPLVDAAWKDDRLAPIPEVDGELRGLVDRAVTARKLSPAERDRYLAEG